MEQLLQEGYGYIAKWVMQSQDISIRAKALYCYLCSYAGRDGVASPSRKLMCFQLDVNDDSLSKYIKELVNNNFITLSQKKFTKTTYHINYNVEPVECENSASNELEIVQALDTNADLQQIQENSGQEHLENNSTPQPILLF